MQERLPLILRECSVTNWIMEEWQTNRRLFEGKEAPLVDEVPAKPVYVTFIVCQPEEATVSLQIWRRQYFPLRVRLPPAKQHTMG